MLLPIGKWVKHVLSVHKNISPEERQEMIKVCRNVKVKV